MTIHVQTQNGNPQTKLNFTVGL